MPSSNPLGLSGASQLEVLADKLIEEYGHLDGGRAVATWLDDRSQNQLVVDDRAPLQINSVTPAAADTMIAYLGDQLPLPVGPEPHYDDPDPEEEDYYDDPRDRGRRPETREEAIRRANNAERRTKRNSGRRRRRGVSCLLVLGLMTATGAVIYYEGPAILHQLAHDAVSGIEHEVEGLLPHAPHITNPVKARHTVTFDQTPFVKAIQGVDKPIVGQVEIDQTFTDQNCAPAILGGCAKGAGVASTTFSGPLWPGATVDLVHTVPVVTFKADSTGRTKGTVHITITVPQPRMPETIDDVTFVPSKAKLTQHIGILVGGWPKPPTEIAVIEEAQRNALAKAQQGDYPARLKAATLAEVKSQLLHLVEQVNQSLGYVVVGDVEWAAPAAPPPHAIPQ